MGIRWWAVPTLLLAARDAGIPRRRELVLELFNSAGRVDELQFARVEGVANAADIDLQLLPRAARGELIAATAGNLRLKVFRMNAVFHDPFASDSVELIMLSRTAHRGKPQRRHSIS